jgi:hypothetical protein
VGKQATMMLPVQGGKGFAGSRKLRRGSMTDAVPHLGGLGLQFFLVQTPDDTGGGGFVLGPAWARTSKENNFGKPAMIMPPSIPTHLTSIDTLLALVLLVNTECSHCERPVATSLYRQPSEIALLSLMCGYFREALLWL